jgi:hypothetical protein
MLVILFFVAKLILDLSHMAGDIHSQGMANYTKGACDFLKHISNSAFVSAIFKGFFNKL